MIKTAKTIKGIDIFKSVFVFSFIAFLFSLTSRVYLTNSLAVKGKELRDLTEKRSLLEKEVTRLQFIDANLSSLASIEIKARESGFSDMKDSISTIKPVTVAVLASQ